MAKILVTTPLYPPEIGGPATYAKLLYERLPTYGFEVEILPFSEVRSWPRGIRHLFYFFKILKRAGRNDLIFAQDPVSTGLLAVLAGKLSGKKVVIRVAGDYAWEQGRNRFGVTDNIDDFQSKGKHHRWPVRFLKKIQSWVVANADQVITPSQYFARLVSGWSSGSLVVCIYNGVEVLPGEKSREVAQKDKLIFSAGRLVPWKGFDTLIELMKDLPDEWKLVIAGDGPKRDKLSRLIKDLNLAERVTLLGAVPRDQLLARLAEAFVFVLNTAFESFSFQVVEAMQAGVPVITTDIGNLREIIEPDQEGILVKPNDKEQIVRALLKLEVDSEFKKSVVLKAKLKSKKFTIDSTLNQLSNLFRAVLNQVR